MMGMPSDRITKAATFFARDMSSVSLLITSLLGGSEAKEMKEMDRGAYEANRGLSWFSMKLPSRVESAQVDLTLLIMSYSSLMLPDVELNALRRG